MTITPRAITTSDHSGKAVTIPIWRIAFRAAKSTASQRAQSCGVWSPTPGDRHLPAHRALAAPVPGAARAPRAGLGGGTSALLAQTLPLALGAAVSPAPADA